MDGIEDLDPSRPEDAAGVADLHLRHLGDSPVAQFGERFLRRFYYGTLVRDGLIGCTICRVEGCPVGFISYTTEPLRFMTRGVKRHPIALAGALLAGFLRRPAALRDSAGVLRLLRDRRREEEAGEMAGLGEILSIATEAERREYVPPGGESRLPVRLFEEAVDRLRERGVRRVQLFVKPDNVASNLFCSSMGCEFEKVTHAGLTLHRYIYVLRGSPGEPRATGAGA